MASVSSNDRSGTGRRLLAVLAHPDDESFGPGGTLALYARRGVEVHLACGTRGELGSAPEELLAGYADVGALREHELKCAAKELGLSGVHLLGYRDSGMLGSPDNQHPRALAAAPLDEVAEQVAHLIREIRPQIVITFDPMGGYRHPDHMAVHRATLEAFHASGDPGRFPGGPPTFRPDKLYYSTFDRRFLRAAVRMMRLVGRDPSHFGRNGDIDLADIAAQDFPTHAHINIREVADVKSRAAACHASQGSPPASGIIGWFSRLLESSETFMRAYPPAPPGLREADLFEGFDLSPL